MEGSAGKCPGLVCKDQGVGRFGNARPSTIFTLPGGWGSPIASCAQELSKKPETLATTAGLCYASLSFLRRPRTNGDGLLFRGAHLMFTHQMLYSNMAQVLNNFRLAKDHARLVTPSDLLRQLTAARDAQLRRCRRGVHFLWRRTHRG